MKQYTHVQYHHCVNNVNHCMPFLVSSPGPSDNLTQGAHNYAYANELQTVAELDNTDISIQSVIGCSHVIKRCAVSTTGALFVLHTPLGVTFCEKLKKYDHR